MKFKSAVIILVILFLNTGYSQFAQKVKLNTGAGIVSPKESFLLLNFFPKMIQEVYGVSLDNSLAPPSSASNFETYWNNGANIGAGLEYHLHRNIAVQVGFDYSQFGINANQFKTELNSLFSKVQAGINVVDFTANRGTADIFTVSARVKLMMPTGFFTPYLSGGGGFMYLHQQPVDISSLVDPLGASFFYRIAEEKSSALLGSGGAGIIFNLSQVVRPYVEGNYFMGLTDQENTIFYSLKAGFVFSMNK